ncbi:hypothetical protein C8Q70DRAFT_320279 [Cubamyces menziesii]|nr:hypothetical protein C8Q70DRAFT_320279 [Cubamyces menziesii]
MAHRKVDVPKRPSPTNTLRSRRMSYGSRAALSRSTGELSSRRIVCGGALSPWYPVISLTSRQCHGSGISSARTSGLRPTPSQRRELAVLWQLRRPAVRHGFRLCARPGSSRVSACTGSPGGGG